MTREEFIKANPIDVVLEEKGVKLIGRGDQRTARCPFHSDKNPSFSVNVPRGVWRCAAGCGGGSVIDLLAMFENVNPIEYMKRNSIGEARRPLFGGGRRLIFQKREKPIPKEDPPKENIKRKIVKCYTYHDMHGRDAYQVVRYEPKHFKQRRWDGEDWVWGMEGCERILYHLPQVLKSKETWICEGERDSDNLCELGFCATTSVGGAQSWLDAYALSLEGKDVVICGDNDKAGKEYIDSVFQSVAGKAATVRIIDLPKEHKDVSDFIATFKDSEKARKALDELRYGAHPFIKGHKILLKTLAQMEENYIRSVENKNHVSFNLAHWMPCLKEIRPLVPGELVLIIGSTGSGKTGLAVSIAMKSIPLPTVLFELELPDDPLFERFVAAKHKMTCVGVEEAYENEENHLGTDALSIDFPNLCICSESGLTVDQIEDQIIHSEPFIGQRLVVAIIDYVQLLRGRGKDRRERFSDIAEELKQLAKRRRVIVILISQTQRPEDKNNPDPEITLWSAKESGSLESSSGLVIGIWRDKKVETLMHGRVLKNTRGKSGLRFKMDFDGAKMLFTEHSPAFGDEVQSKPSRRSHDE